MCIRDSAWCEFTIGDKQHRLKILKSTMIDDLDGSAGTVLDDALTIACGAGAVRLISVQRSGKGVMDAAEFLRGNNLTPGARLL